MTLCNNYHHTLSMSFHDMDMGTEYRPPQVLNGALVSLCLNLFYCNYVIQFSFIVIVICPRNTIQLEIHCIVFCPRMKSKRTYGFSPLINIHVRRIISLNHWAEFLNILNNCSFKKITKRPILICLCSSLLLALFQTKAGKKIFPVPKKKEIL